MKRRKWKQPRLRLEPDAYRQLTRGVLARDGWRCQDCGRSQNLQVHHIRPRSRLGDDTEENLITLCAKCHGARHLHHQTPRVSNIEPDTQKLWCHT
jgi:5-methylcytosine-specific restriction endonuclease McrA